MHLVSPVTSEAAASGALFQVRKGEITQAPNPRQRLLDAAFRNSSRLVGPMHGIPFGLKDIYSTAGIRTTGHSKICSDIVPSADATTVRGGSTCGAAGGRLGAVCTATTCCACAGAAGAGTSVGIDVSAAVWACAIL